MKKYLLIFLHILFLKCSGMSHKRAMIASGQVKYIPKLENFGFVSCDNEELENIIGRKDIYFHKDNFIDVQEWNDVLKSFRIDKKICLVYEISKPFKNIILSTTRYKALNIKIKKFLCCEKCNPEEYKYPIIKKVNFENTRFANLVIKEGSFIDEILKTQKISD